MQLVDAVEPTAIEYFPSVQLMQLVDATDSEYVPATHLLHAVRPSTAANRPYDPFAA